jgi:hypothetical protein
MPFPVRQFLGLVNVTEFMRLRPVVVAGATHG